MSEPTEHPFAAEMHEYLNKQMRDQVEAAKRYLDEHPDQPGVTIVPTVNVGSEVVEFEPVTYMRLPEVAETDGDGMPARTTKRVTGTFTATFHGDYVEADEIPGVLEGWIDAGLDDRDDLRSWNFTVTDVTIVAGDPEGYDR